MRYQCTIINGTRYEVTLRKPGQFIPLSPGQKYIQRIDPNDTYRAWEVLVEDASVTFFSQDDFAEWSEISIQEGPHGAFQWVGTVIRPSNQFSAAAYQTSKKFDEALRSCNDLEKLYGRAKICRHQCNHLFQTYKEGIQTTAQLYSRLNEDKNEWQLLRRGLDEWQLKKLDESLDSLEYIVCDAKDLLSTCAKELGKVALVVSIPRPPVEENMEVYSEFDLLIRELEWHMDVIEYLIKRSVDAELIWMPAMCRYVLKRSDENDVAQETAPNQRKPSRLAGLDRDELQSGLRDGSVYIPNPIYGWFAWQLFGMSKNNLNETILKRCEARNLQSCEMALEALKTEHQHLHPRGKKLGGGNSKEVYEGNWYGQSVAIATINLGDSDDPVDPDKPSHSQILSKEVSGLLKLQHPKVVSLFGWAETTDAPAPIKKPDAEHRVHGGYIVTEKMKENLDTLMKKQKDPFSPSVQIDILLQIVEAMLYVHKYEYMHRDLKPGNILVNPRSSPARPGADTFYNVKLIDFGSSKEDVAGNTNTRKTGTGWYRAPEVLEDSGKYGKPVDVFSFAMICYQVITRRYLTVNRVAALIKKKERPPFPPTVLQDLSELTEKCWSEKPEDRPSFKEIQERLWTLKMKLAVD